jgi:hypothetical protein
MVRTVEEGFEPFGNGAKIQRKLKQDRAGLAAENERWSSSSSRPLTDFSESRFQWVMNLDVFQARTSRSRSAARALGRTALSNQPCKRDIDVVKELTQLRGHSREVQPKHEIPARTSLRVHLKSKVFPGANMTGNRFIDGRVVAIAASARSSQRSASLSQFQLASG